MGNTFGRIFRLSTWGESHGPALGGMIDGCPAGIEIAEDFIQRELDLRRPGNADVGSTSRNETDQVRLLSGVFQGVSTGTPIAFIIENRNQHSADYSNLANTFRPGHADYTFQQKFGIRDHRGGGRSSGRETVARVAGGAIALALLARHGISLNAFTLEYAGIVAPVTNPEGAANRVFFAPDEAVVEQWKHALDTAKANGDTIGGIVQITATGVPPGLGEPVFDKLDAVLAHALMSVGTVKAVEIGDGCEAVGKGGITNNDLLLPQGRFASNHAGGILGGISTGQPIVARAYVKPIASVGLPQDTVNSDGVATQLTIRGRHDVSAIPRIVPVLKALTALVIADMLLLQDSRKGTQDQCR